MEDKRTDAPAQNLNDSHAVQRLHPSQGGAPVRGNELLIGPQGSMQQHSSRLLLLDVFVLLRPCIFTRPSPEVDLGTSPPA